MEIRKWVARILVYGLRGLVFSVACVAPHSIADTLDEGFANPPKSAAPAVFWYWVSDMISMDGITKDLEAMARIGIGEAYIGNVDVNLDHRGEAAALSEEWWELISFAIEEGGRTGVDIGLFNSPGWSQSGGPWVSPEESMRYLAQSETRVTGPVLVDRILPKPFQDFQDVAVLAFPLPDRDEDEISNLEIDIATNADFPNVGAWFDGSAEEAVGFPEGAAVGNDALEIDIELEESRTIRSLLVYPEDGRLYFEGELQARDREGAFELVESFTVDRREDFSFLGPMGTGPICVTFPGVESDAFQLVLKNRRADLSGGLSEISLTGAARLERFVEKQLGRMWHSPLPEWDAYLWEEPEDAGGASLTVPVSQVLDLSRNLSADGAFNWSAPEGEWRVLRIGMTPTGVENGPASPQATGLEVDKMSRRHVGKHFDAYVGEALRRIPERDRPALTKVILDSYERGPQNWTDGFAQTFVEEYDYDPIPWLPVLTGRVVNSADQSERFLWDLRRLVANRIASEYAGGLRDVAHRQGLNLWMENYGHWGFPAEFLQYGGQSDEVSGEFWVDSQLGQMELRAAASSAHVYGKNLVSAEAFTSGSLHWTHTPHSLKKLGDWAQTQGANRFAMHVYIHQPDERKPGVNAPFGSEINRHNTWFSEAGEWINSIKRSHFLLQQGTPVADIAYFVGEDAPKMTGVLDPALPDGYNFDFINAEVIKNRLSVEDGVFVLPEGQRYRILVLPPLDTMRPEVLARIKELVSRGGTIIGCPPERSPSLQDFPEADERVARMAGEMWSDDREGCMPFGDGLVCQGVDLDYALERLAVTPDLEGADRAAIPFVHRSTEDAEIYFLSNQQDVAADLSMRFRVVGLVPELWDAVSSEKRVLTDFTQHCDQIEVPLHFEPGQSFFLVFRTPIPAGLESEANFPAASVVGTVEDVWTVFFDPELGGPGTASFGELVDWSQREEAGIRHYSGTARYTNSLTLLELHPENHYYLDLGDVRDIARVRVNGADLGTIWTNPWHIDISEALIAGENQLEIEVTNTWVNRIIGDAVLPESEKLTWTVHPHYSRNSELRVSGLLGPVSVLTRPAGRALPIDDSHSSEQIDAHIRRYSSCFGLAENALLRDADPDEDGWTNFSEWFFGSDPTTPNTSVEILRITGRGTGEGLSLEFNRLSSYGAFNLDYTIRYSDDLESPANEWIDLDLSSARVFKKLKRNGYDRVVLELETSIAPLFFRAEVAPIP